MVIKIVLGLLLLFMVYNLFKAMMIMVKPGPNPQSMTKFIGRRVLFSSIIILLILIAMATGIIQPNPRPY